MHIPAHSLFRAYDIRGVVDIDLNAADFLSIGHAYASMLAERCQCRTPLIVAMRDGRNSSPNLMEAMVEGMLKAGAHVLDAGVGPTPMCYFATHHLNADGCVMITGSHNPPNHNGAKFMVEGLSLYGAELAALRRRIEHNQLLHSRGKREEVDMHEEYLFELNKALGQSAGLEKLSVGFDAGNGAAGPVIAQLLSHHRSRPHVGLYLDSDGQFPNHHPDPAEPKNLADLQRAVLAEKLDLGVAFDGDGDRMGAVDDLGRPVSPDHLLMLLAGDVLAHEPGATIIADVKTSDAFFARVKAQGGTPLMWMTGHAHIKTKMLQANAKFAGEASGHIFFADSYYGYDDGLYAAMRLIRLVAESGQKLSALVDVLPALYTTEEIRVPCPDAEKFAVIERLQQQFPTAVTLDGLRVSTEDGWFLIRASNTQAVLSARAEGNSPEALVRLRAQVDSLLSVK
ncbi:MAG: phosphomannomutase/phosphoglucomutase [Rickettsiales bacterium]